jgi:integrase
MLGKLDKVKDRAAWATAIYAGLRRGELLALRREDIDLAAGVIHVRRGWDQEVGEVKPRSAQGRRKVPIPAALRDRLVEYIMERPAEGRIFVGLRECYMRGRAAAAAAKVEEPTLHECRHGYASVMIAAGVNVKALSTFMGHANIRSRSTNTATFCPARRTRRQGCSTRSWRARSAGPNRSLRGSRLARRLVRAPSKASSRAGSSRCTTSRSGA